MAPPITRVSTRFTRFSSSAILVETFAPPTTASTGRSGLPSAFSRWVSSACMERPAALGSRCATPSVVAWARWAAEKASLTKMSPSAASCFGHGGIVVFLALVEAGVFQQQNLAVLQRGDGRFGLGPDAVLGETRPCGPPRPTAAATSTFSDMDGTTLPLGRSKWLSTITRAPLCASSRMVGAWRTMRVASVTLPSCDRHVEVGAHQHALALHVQVVEGAEPCFLWLSDDL